MAGPSSWTVYDLSKRNMGLKVDNYATDIFKIALFKSTSNCSNPSLSPCTFANLTGELPTANGYTVGGASVTVTWSDASGTETFTFSPALWTPSGAGLTWRYAVLYDVTSGNLIGFVTGDSTPLDVTNTPGNPLQIVADSSGMFQLS